MLVTHQCRVSTSLPGLYLYIDIWKTNNACRRDACASKITTKFTALYYLPDIYIVESSKYYSTFTSGILLYIHTRLKLNIIVYRLIFYMSRNRTYHSYRKGGVPEGSGRTMAASAPGAARTVRGPAGNDGGSMGSSPLGPRAPGRVRAHAPARPLSINNTKKCTALNKFRTTRIFR